LILQANGGNVTTSAIDVFDPAHRFVPTQVLHEAYLTYDESRSPGAPTFVSLADGYELGIITSTNPVVALAISSLLTRSLEQARCELGGHLPTDVVRRVQQDIISPEGVTKLWGRRASIRPFAAGRWSNA
jgi:hypothetical protein